MLPFFAVEEFAYYAPHTVTIDALNLGLPLAFEPVGVYIGINVGIERVAEEIVQVYAVVRNDAETNVTAFRFAVLPFVFADDLTILAVPLHARLGVSESPARECALLTFPQVQANQFAVFLCHSHVVTSNEVPAKAQRDMDLMTANVEAAAPKKVVAAAPPAPTIDPVDQCVKDFHQLGSKAFQLKYLNNTNNRRFYETAIDRGLL